PQATCITAKAGVNNQINPACFDPVTVALLTPTYLPLPTLTNGNPFYYANNGITNDTQQDQVYKVDYALTPKQALMVRVSYEESDNINAARNYNDPSPTPGSSTYTPGMNAGIRWTSDFTTNFINVAAIGLAWTKGDSKLSNYTMPLCGSSACIAQAYPGADTLNRLPNLELTGSGNWSWIGEGALPTDTTDSDAIYSDDVTWIKHNHIFQFGGLYLRGNKSQSSGTFPAPMGVYTFSGTQSGDTAADFLLGLDSTYQQANVQRAGYFHYGWWELYLQDDWKVTPRLTVNLGVRWSYFQPETVVTNDLTSFQTSAYSSSTAPAVSMLGAFTFNSSGQPLTPGGAVANLTDGLVTAGADSSATLPVSSEPGFYKPKDSDFAPRLGFAYALTADGKTAVRGGFGMGYTPVALERNPAFLTNPPFTQSVTINNGLTSQPLIGSAPGTPTITPTSLFAFSGDFQPTVTESYSLFIERQLSSSAVFNVGYAGNKSQHVTDEAVNENFPLDGSNSLSPSCAGLASNPLNSTTYAYKGPAVVQQYDPCINALPSGTTTESTGGLQTFYAPYQGWTSISGTYSEGIANYNALQTSFILRRRDLNLNFAYTYSKSLTDVQPGGQGVSYDQAGGFQNPNNPMAEYGEPDFDRTNVFTGAWVYQMPFFKNADSQALRTALAGWNFSGLAIIENGFALTPTLGTANAGLATRPNIVGPIQYLNGSAAGGWVSPASFQQPAFGTFGDETIGNIRGPGEVTFNIALDKQFQIHERFNIQLRGEAFNVFNHTNFSTLNLTWNSNTSTTFGKATGAFDPRIIELMARFNF
ncbi:MAG: TonB-dependent receptor, partial [Candidatus Acidiferrales bacterium]